MKPDIDVNYDLNAEFEQSEIYELMIDKMLDDEEKGKIKYVSLAHIRNKFLKTKI